MKIIAASTEDRKALYNLTRAVKVGKVVDLDGQTITVSEWALYDDTDSEGSEKRVLTMVLDTGEIVGTISKTFISAFVDIVDVIGELPPLRVETSTTKNGRTFVYPVPV